MSKLLSALGIFVVTLGVTLAGPSQAHYAHTLTSPVPILGPGDSFEFTMHCPHHQYVISGGHSSEGELAPNSPIRVTASYPASTRTWAIEVTNTAGGRPNGAQEVVLTMHILCGHHW